MRVRQVCDQEELDWERLADATRRPSRLSTAVVDDLELITDRQRRLYRVRPEPLREIDLWLAPYRVMWAESLDALEEHLDDVED